MYQKKMSDPLLEGKWAGYNPFSSIGGERERRDACRHGPFTIKKKVDSLG